MKAVDKLAVNIEESLVAHADMIAAMRKHFEESDLFLLEPDMSDLTLLRYCLSFPDLEKANKAFAVAAVYRNKSDWLKPARQLVLEGKPLEEVRTRRACLSDVLIFF